MRVLVNVQSYHEAQDMSDGITRVIELSSISRRLINFYGIGTLMQNMMVDLII